MVASWTVVPAPTPQALAAALLPSAAGTLEEEGQPPIPAGVTIADLPAPRHRPSHGYTAGGLFSLAPPADLIARAATFAVTAAEVEELAAEGKAHVAIEAALAVQRRVARAVTDAASGGSSGGSSSRSSRSGGAIGPPSPAAGDRAGGIQ